ncbi:hypothetical protein ACSSS7_005399 [Eimeria intestinalis]
MYAVTKSRAMHEVEDIGNQSEFPGPSGDTALRRKTLPDAEAAEDAATSYLLKPMSCPLHLSLFFDDAEERGRNSPFNSVNSNFMQSHDVFPSIHMLQWRLSPGPRLNVLKQLGICIAAACVVVARRPECSKGSSHEWAYAEGLLRNALEKLGFSFTVAVGDGAFYGPKVDLLIPDAFGRLWQAGTLQVALLTVGPKQAVSAECLAARLRKSGIRVSVDTRLIHLAGKLKCGQQRDGINN